MSNQSSILKGNYILQSLYTKRKNNCCKSWRNCVYKEECILDSNFWDPIRERLSQGDLKKAQLVTLDCYIFPTELDKIGLVIETKKESAKLLIPSGRITIALSSNIFILPSVDSLSGLRIFLEYKSFN